MDTTTTTNSTASNHIIRTGVLSHAVPTTTDLAVFVRGGDNSSTSDTNVTKLADGRFLFSSLDDLEGTIASRCVLVRRTCSFPKLWRSLALMTYAVDHTPDKGMVSCPCRLILIGLEDVYINALEDVGEVLWDSATSTP